MAKLYFRYGNGKSAHLCQVAYNYSDLRKMNVAIINAFSNETIESKIVIDGRKVLKREPNLEISDSSLYKDIYRMYIEDDIRCVLVDNAEYLTYGQSEDLFYISKLLDIPVIAYGNRMILNKDTSVGVSRLMSLADDIEKIDMFPASKEASLDYIYGAMSCSKTAQLLTNNQALMDKGFNTCIIKPKLDREELYVASRIGLKAKADIVLDTEDTLNKKIDFLLNQHINYILVDEVQFLTVNQIEELRRVVDKLKITIACYGLKNDFLSNLFPASQRLLKISDNIYKMNTVCSCGHGANFNVRKDKFGNYITSGNQVCIDKGDNYDSECALCFMEHVMGINIKSKDKVRKK